MKSIIRLVFYSVAAMIITACGGGGGAAAGPVGPVVVSTIPAKDATDVPTATKVSATFSVPIANIPFTNFTSVFTLKNPAGAIVSGTMAVVPSTNNTKWEFTPNASLAIGTKYTATFKKGPGGINDLATPPHPMAADYVWSFTTGGWNGTQMLGTIVNEKANGVVTDLAGNIYVTGYTNGNLDGIANADTNPLTAGTTGDVFLVKYNAAGVKQWTRLLGSRFNDVANGIAIDNTFPGGPFIYVAGFTNGTLPSTGPTNPDPTGATSNAFVAKFDTAGNTIWVRQSGTASNNKAYGVAVDAVGNVYIAGETGDTPAVPTSGDIFLAQYSPAGLQNWIKTLASTPAAKDRAYGVAVSGSNIYVAGFTNGVLPGNTSAGGSDLFVALFDAVATNPNPVWVRQLGTAATDIAFAVAADASGVYAAGSTNGGLFVPTSAGGFDAFVVKYDATGTKLWSNQMGTAGDDDAFGITIDASGNSYITGDTFGVLPGTPAGTVNKGLFDLFVARLNATGTTAWVRQQGSVWTDVGYAVAFSNVGTTPSLYVAGATFGTLPGVNVHFNNADPTGNTADLFLAKYDTTGLLFQ